MGVKVRPDNKKRAAYAASSPLYEALRLAIRQTGEADRNLAAAKTIVQRIHVKLGGKEGTYNGCDVQDVMHILAKTWKNTAEVYGKIWHEVEALTAEDSAEGRESQEGQELFAAMARDAGQSLATAARFPFQTVGLNGAESVVEGVGQKKHEMYKARMKAREEEKKKLKASRKAKQQADHAASNGTNTFPNDGNAVPTRPNTNLPGGGAAGDDFISLDAGDDGVMYEDPSTAVEARLKAKDETKKAKAVSKKRKRDSGERFPAAAIEANDGLRQLKKARISQSAAAGVEPMDGIETLSVKKRSKRNHVDRPPKKRQRSKA